MCVVVLYKDKKRYYFRGKVLATCRAAAFTAILHPIAIVNGAWANRSQRMGRPVVQYVAGKKGAKYYVCKGCKRHLAAYDSIVSKAFQGQSGQAYLFESAVNVYTGPKMERVLMTGLHVVCDLYCVPLPQPAGVVLCVMHTRKVKSTRSASSSWKRPIWSARGIDFCLSRVIFARICHTRHKCKYNKVHGGK